MSKSLYKDPAIRLLAALLRCWRRCRRESGNLSGPEAAEKVLARRAGNVRRRGKAKQPRPTLAVTAP